jgi:hypothetical protein
LASGDFLVQNCFKESFIGAENPLMPIILGMEMKQKFGVF